MHTSKITASLGSEKVQARSICAAETVSKWKVKAAETADACPACIEPCRLDSSSVPPSLCVFVYVLCVSCVSVCVLHMCVVCVCLCICYVCVVYVMCVCMCIVCVVCVVCMCTSGVHLCIYKIRAGDQHMNSTVFNSVLLGSIICPMHTSTSVPSAHSGSGKFYTSVKVSKLW